MRGLWPISALPLATAVLASAVFVGWMRWRPDVAVPLREPIQRSADASAGVAVDLAGTFANGPGEPSKITDAWPNFRGINLDAVAPDSVPLARTWGEHGPIKLWTATLGEGYAGPAVKGGRVYVTDYDQAKRADALRCLSLDDGREIWRRSYAVDTPRNHGITRTVPAVTQKYVVSLGPRCHVLCVDAETGDYRWGIDLVRQYGTTVPPWYAGQCPLIDGDRVILAPGGDALMIAVDLATGEVVWKTPNPQRWEMTHSSIVPMTFAGRRMFIYCASGGVVGVDAEDGSIVFQTTAWKVSMANVPTPVVVGEDRIFVSGGYGAGAAMLKLSKTDGRITVTAEYRLKPTIFGAEQHSPIYHEDSIFGVIPGGQLVCLGPDGEVRWKSGTERFGLGPYMIADGLIILVNDTGVLSLVEANGREFKLVAKATVIEDAHESWGPLALVDGRLLLRDMTHMVCVDLRKASYD